MVKKIIEVEWKIIKTTDKEYERWWKDNYIEPAHDAAILLLKESGQTILTVAYSEHDKGWGSLDEFGRIRWMGWDDKKELLYWDQTLESAMLSAEKHMHVENVLRNAISPVDYELKINQPNDLS